MDFTNYYWINIKGITISKTYFKSISAILNVKSQYLLHYSTYKKYFIFCYVLIIILLNIKITNLSIIKKKYKFNCWFTFNI